MNAGAACRTVIGVDCATDPRKVGLARARRRAERWRVVDARLGSRARPPHEVVASWLAEDPDALLALDAPLGWPAELSAALAPHRAGEAVATPPGTLFSRATDRHVQAAYRRRPLDVGADRIARTAHAALAFLEEVRRATERPIPLAWRWDSFEPPAAIEVYPAATLIAHGLPSKRYKKAGSEARREIGAALAARFELPEGFDATVASDHLLDAILCVVAGVDFLRGDAVPPEDERLARREGWIWIRRRVDIDG